MANYCELTVSFRLIDLTGDKLDITGPLVRMFFASVIFINCKTFCKKKTVHSVKFVYIFNVREIPQGALKIYGNMLGPLLKT